MRVRKMSFKGEVLLSRAIILIFCTVMMAFRFRFLRRYIDEDADYLSSTRCESANAIWEVVLHLIQLKTSGKRCISK